MQVLTSLERLDRLAILQITLVLYNASLLLESMLCGYCTREFFLKQLPLLFSSDTVKERPRDKIDIKKNILLKTY